MKIGITGAHGFVGSNLINFFKNSFECEAFDKNKYDLFDVDSMRTFVEDKDAIFHLAGQNRATNEHIMKTNTYGTLCLLESIRKYSTKKPKFIFASSMQVYGFTNSTHGFIESDNLKIDTVYGLSKKCSEDTIELYSNLYGINSLIYRISNVYGKGCRPFYNSVISTFIELIKNGKTLSITGNGDQSRDFIYISDLVLAFNKALDYSPNGKEIFNICTGKPVSINNLINIIENVTGNMPMVEYISPEEKNIHLIGDPVKASKILGFTATTSIEEGIKKTIN